MRFSFTFAVSILTLKFSFFFQNTYAFTFQIKCPRFSRLKAISSTSKQKEFSSTDSSHITCLEVNSWCCSLNGIQVFVDPVFDTLDFGIPFIYQAKRKVLKNVALEDQLVKNANVMLISQGLPDHCCSKTQARLSKRLSEHVKIIASPSAAPVLDSLYEKGRVTYLSPGQTVTVATPLGTLKVKATSGALVGPPWQAKENGYLLSCDGVPSIYYEPHCMYDEKELSTLQADYLVTPVVKTLIPLYGPLVDGMEKSIKLAKLLKSKHIIPLMNGDVDASGPLDSILSREGSLADFKDLLQKSGLFCQLENYEPGERVVLCKKS